MPNHIRQERADHLQQWTNDNGKYLNKSEIDGLNRTISYTRNIEEGHSVQEVSDLQTRQYDFFNFYNQYDVRRNKLFEKAFSDWPDMIEWYLSLADNNSKRHVVETVEANALDWGEDIFNEVINGAVSNGLINGPT